MIGTVLLVVCVLAVAGRAADGVRLRQQEAILNKLKPAEAAAFYKVLRQRAWKVRILRAVAVLSIVTIVYARNRAWRIPAVAGTVPAQSAGQPEKRPSHQ